MKVYLSYTFAGTMIKDTVMKKFNVTFFFNQITTKFRCAKHDDDK